MHVRMHACTVRALRRISFVVFGQLGGVELPRGSHQFSLCHAKLGIEIILNIIHVFFPKQCGHTEGFLR